MTNWLDSIDRVLRTERSFIKGSALHRTRDEPYIKVVPQRGGNGESTGVMLGHLNAKKNYHRTGLTVEDVLQELMLGRYPNSHLELEVQHKTWLDAALTFYARDSLSVQFKREGSTIMAGLYLPTSPFGGFVTQKDDAPKAYKALLALGWRMREHVERTQPARVADYNRLCP